LRNGWTLPALEREGVLEAAALHVDDGREFHFVSMVPCRPLQELADQARRAANADQLRERLSAELLTQLERLASGRVWLSDQRAYQILRSLHVRWPQPDTLQSENVILAEVVLDGAPPGVLTAALMEMATSQSGRLLDRDAILVEAVARGLRPRDARGRSTDARRSVADASAKWLTATRDAMLRPPIERSDGIELAKLLAAGDYPLVMAVGEAGAGKTAVLAHVVEDFCRQPGWHVLALRLDRAAGVASTQELGAQVSLDASPVTVLAEEANNAPCILVIDSWTRLVS
jgi:hypothetical protein